MATEFSETFLG